MQVSIKYGLGSSLSTEEIEEGVCSNLTEFSTLIPNLIPGQWYHYQIIATSPFYIF